VGKFVQAIQRSIFLERFSAADPIKDRPVAPACELPPKLFG